MANTFGTSSLRLPLYDPRRIRDARVRFRRDQVPELTYANSLYVPSGPYPACGWLLLRRADYATLQASGLYGTSYQLEVDQFDPQLPALTFGNLAIVQARCVSTGISADDDAIYLVQVTDRRGVIANRWAQFPTNNYYNVRSPAYPGLYYADSLTGGSAWTWTQLVQSLWEQMPLLGAYPGLPVAPASTPDGFNLPGVSAWHAINRILSHIGCVVAVDLTAAVPYTIASKGAADATFTGLMTTHAGRLEDDLEWIDIGSGRVPGTVIVYFHRRNTIYGTEETVRRDTLQWQMHGVYSISVAAPATFTGAAGTHHLWDDFTIRYDIDGVADAGDVTTATTIATERVAQYFRDIYSSTSGYLRRTYAGLIPFATGSLCDGVCWRQDFREVKRMGWQTQVCRGAWPLWDVKGW